MLDKTRIRYGGTYRGAWNFKNGKAVYESTKIFIEKGGPARESEDLILEAENSKNQRYIGPLHKLL